MSDLNQPGKILSKGWKRIEFPRRVYENDADSFTPIIPSDTLLDELISIPESLWFDPLEFQRYRNEFLPQEYDHENQKKLRDYSNNLVDELNKNRIGSPEQSETNKFLQAFCARYSISYEQYEFNSLLVRYVKNILPFSIPTRKERTLEETLLVSRYGECNTRKDFMEVNSFVEVNGRKLTGYKPSQFIEDFSAKLSPEEHNKLVERILKKYKKVDNNYEQLKEYRKKAEYFDNIRGNRFSEFDCAMREKKNFISMHVERREGVKEYNHAVIKDLENSRKKSREDADNTCLRQCSYCYRFRLGTGRISSTCGSEKCKKLNDARKKFLKYKDQNFLKDK
jgi:hypothetical protein